MTEEQSKSINQAIEIVISRTADKLEGKGWKIYRVGNVVRIDIKDES